MAGIFLSHSSKDKSFVQRFAIDLSAEGFPVWFDSWELEAGDELDRQIEQGIDESTLLVVILSKNSTSSDWVHRELARALERERQLSRKFVIPIVIDDCSIPVAVANRIYSNFRDEPYRNALERFAETFNKWGAKDWAVDPKRRIIPLVFTRGVYLDRRILEDSLRPIPVNHLFDMEQLVLGPDENYAVLRAKLQRAIDEVATWPEYTPETEQYVQGVYKHVRLLEKGMLRGVKQVLDHMRPYGYMEPCFWFCRIIRQDLLARLWGSQRKASGEVIDYGKGEPSPLESPQKAAKFFEVAKVDRVQCFPRDGSGYFGAWIDSGSTTSTDLHDTIGIPEPLLGVCHPHIIQKYLIPQMLLSNLLLPTDPVSFDYKDWMVGLA